MTPERIAELRRLREEYRQAHVVMLDATPLPGETNGEWQAACGVNAAARSAWVTALHESEDDLLATAEREAKLREALEGMTELWLNVGGTELNPAYEDAIAALDQKGDRTVIENPKLEAKGGE